MNPEKTHTQRWRKPSWRQLALWPVSVFVVVYLTQSLWLPLLTPWMMQRGRDPRATITEKQRAWAFAYRRAAESKSPELLMAIAKDTSAPGEARGSAWAALAQRSQQTDDHKKAGECYMSAFDCLVTDPNLTGKGYTLRDEVWNQLRLQLGTTIDPERYRSALISWAERTTDQRLLQQLVFEVGKMKVLAKAELPASATGDKP